MKGWTTFWDGRHGWFDPVGRERQIKNYIALTDKLTWKRQFSFLSVGILSALYFDPISILTFYVFVVITELFDVLLARQCKAWNGSDPIVGRRILKRITFNTITSATAVTAFIVNIALQQESTGHYTPLFFMFSAAVFAAMYNSQMQGILLLRLLIYSVGFLTIAFLDVVRYFPPLSNEIWLEFFTTIFVLYFIADIAGKFYRNSHEQLEQMDRIKEENKRTKDALEIKSQFLATVSHELRTPLTSTVGSLELIKSEKIGSLPDKLKPILDIASRNGRRLTKLVEDLLDLQKIEAGEVEIHFEPIDANELAAEAVASASGYASKLGIDVMTALHVEPCRIAGDRDRLIQIMNNLLSNAIKFSNEGGTVNVCVENRGARIRISVVDEGVGIPTDARERVFGRFSQVDSSDIRKVGGTGLGLNISQQLAERHNATLDYTSEVGVGSTFYIEFDRLKDGDGDGGGFEPFPRAA